MKRKVYDILLKDMCERFPGRTFTQQEIADYVGIDRQRVTQIEEQALNEIKSRLQHADVADIIAAIRSADGRRV